MAYVRKTTFHKEKYGEMYGTKTRNYCIWSGLRKRGLGKDKTNNHKYYDKGIRICDEWLSYDNFAKWSKDNGYNDELSIDRIDNSKGYYPENCRWATKYEQAENKKNVPLYTYNGETRCLPSWARKTGIKQSTLKERIRVGKWSFEKAITTPVRGGVLFH